MSVFGMIVFAFLLGFGIGKLVGGERPDDWFMTILMLVFALFWLVVYTVGATRNPRPE